MKLKTLTNLFAAVQLLREEAPELPIQQLHLFLAIAMDEGVGTKDLEQRYGYTNAATSRNVTALYKYPGQGRSGLDWVRWQPSPMDGRKRELFLTDKGKEVIEKVLNRLEV